MDTNIEMMLRQFAFFRKAYSKICIQSLIEYNFSPSEMEILIFLSNNPNINTAKEIALYLNILKSLVCRSVDSLNKRGLLHLVEDKNDHRIKHLYLKDDSQHIIHRIKENQKIFRGKMLEGIDPAIYDLMIDTMNTINVNIECILEGGIVNESSK